MTPGWITTTLLDNDAPGGWAVARSREGFLHDDNGPLFPREWLKRQDLSVFAEHGIGHLDGEPVYLLELNSAAELPGCSWQGLRGFMLQGDHTLYKVLGYAAQIGTKRRQLIRTPHLVQRHAVQCKRQRPRQPERAVRDRKR